MESGGNPRTAAGTVEIPLPLARSEQAYMFQHAMNIVLGPKQDRQLLTGFYIIAEIYCSQCGEELGWKYVQAYDFKNRYKEGKFILEELKMVKDTNWLTSNYAAL